MKDYKTIKKFVIKYDGYVCSPLGNNELPSLIFKYYPYYAYAYDVPVPSKDGKHK